MFEIYEGRLFRDQKPFISTGFNYIPSGAGCRYWEAWDPSQIDRDFSTIASYGFNTVSSCFGVRLSLKQATMTTRLSRG
jgi:hypothetical protein